MRLRTLLSLVRKPPPPLPPRFLFGVATADHQCEAYDPAREDVWDVWERVRGLTPRGRATDFWSRYGEDIALAQRLGCRAFRFSIAWSRAEPSPGVYDEAAFEHYRQVAAAIRAAGMEPIATLHHFTWPLHIEQRGGMTDPAFPEWFRDYAREAARRLGSEVCTWITFNEPTQLVYGYVKPWWLRDYAVPPGLPDGATLEQQLDRVGALMRNLFEAHRLARQEIKRARPEAQVGANPLLLGLPVWLQRLVDWNVTRLRRRDDLVKQGQRFAERPLLERGAVDVVVATLTRTPERARQVAFSDTYYVAGQMLLVPAGSGLASAARLDGGTLAAVKTSTAEREAPRLFPTARLLRVDDYPAALVALEAGRADALLADDVILRGLVAAHPGRYRLLGERLTDEPYAAAVALGSGELLDVVNAAVREFKASGAWAASYAEHLGPPIPVPPPATGRALADAGPEASPAAARATPGAPAGPLPLAREGTALRRIQDRGCLVVAVKQDVPGFGYRDPRTGELRGLEIDLARAIAGRLFGDPARVRFVPATTQQRIPLLRSLLRFLDPLLKAYSVLSTGLTSNWWHLGMAGKLPELLCPPECVGQQDFVGLDYYWGISTLRLDRLQALLEASIGRFDRAPVWPGALYGMLRYHAKLLPRLPILIVENGSVDQADGVERAEYLRWHVREVQRAVRAGAPVSGYLCWSITSNREWGLPFGPSNDFGLYHVALDSDPALRRVATPAAEVYRDIIATGAAKRDRDSALAPDTGAAAPLTG